MKLDILHNMTSTYYKTPVIKKPLCWQYRLANRPREQNGEFRTRHRLLWLFDFDKRDKVIKLLKKSLFKTYIRITEYLYRGGDQGRQG